MASPSGRATRRPNVSSATSRATSKRGCGRCSRPKAASPPLRPPRRRPTRTARSISSAAMRLIDVEHLGRERVIGCWEVDGALVDPGPESSLETVLAKLGDEVPRAVLLTHIHLDHAAATGALVERWPELEVYVHERGAPHLVD